MPERHVNNLYASDMRRAKRRVNLYAALLVCCGFLLGISAGWVLGSVGAL